MSMKDTTSLPGEQSTTRTQHTSSARDTERSQAVLDDVGTSLASVLQRKAEAPIGVFDSGAGGLTILSTLRQELPQETYLYFGDKELERIGPT